LIKKGNFEVSVGKAVGHVFEDLLISAKKRLWIMSPWIASDYAELAVKKKGDGVDVQIVTTNDYSINSAALKKLIEAKVEVIEGKILWLIPTRKERIYHVSRIGEGNLTVQDRSTRFTHAKIYIIDDAGAVGSVNLTWKGLWHNVEVLVIMKDEKDVEKLVGTFHSIKEHPLVRKIEIDELANYLFTPQEKAQPTPVAPGLQERIERFDKEMSEKLKRYLGA